VRALFSEHRAVGWTVVLLLSVLVALAAVLLLPILIPAGPSFLRVLAEGRINPVARALEFVGLLVGLYLVTRTVQSRESRRMARQVADAVVRYLDDDLAPRLAGGGPAAMDCEEYRALATGLLEARVYRFDRLTLAGRLPVYLLTPDLSLVADAETLAALRGHLDLGSAGSAGVSTTAGTTTMDPGDEGEIATVASALLRPDGSGASAGAPVPERADRRE
jgi:hypothetical protein